MCKTSHEERSIRTWRLVQAADMDFTTILDMLAEEAWIHLRTRHDQEMGSLKDWGDACRCIPRLNDLRQSGWLYEQGGQDTTR